MIASLTGCIVNDMPPFLESTSVSYAVATQSAAPPYDIISFTRIHDSAEGHTLVQRRTFKPFSQGCFASWCWTVRAAAELVSACRSYRRLAEEVVSACSRETWTVAFEMAYRTAKFLLQHKPLPLRIRALLIPKGYSYVESYQLRSVRHVPLEFAFIFPAQWRAPGFAAQTLASQAKIVSTIVYEFQHVEYAANQTGGPSSSALSRVVKDEANSECWRLATNVELERYTGIRVDIEEYGKSTKHWVSALAEGSKPRFGNAAVYGPVFLDRSLGNYLRTHFPHLAFSGGIVVVSREDRRAQRALLSYCRAFTKYSNDIIKAPMPSTYVNAGLR